MNIYYSRSNNVNDSEMNVYIDAFIENLPDHLRKVINVTNHDRGSEYNSQLLEKADLVIVGMPDCNPNAYIGKGCGTEIEKAFELDIPVLVITADQTIDSEMFMMQSISPEDILCRNPGDYFKYMPLNLYTSFDEEYLPSTFEDNMLFDIRSKGDIEDAMKRLGLFDKHFTPSAPTKYNFGDTVSFYLDGKQVDYYIDSFTLRPITKGTAYLLDKLGVKNKFLQEACLYSQVYTYYNLWKAGSVEHMNVIIKCLLSLNGISSLEECKQAIIPQESVPSIVDDDLLLLL